MAHTFKHIPIVIVVADCSHLILVNTEYTGKHSHSIALICIFVNKIKGNGTRINKVMLLTCSIRKEFSYILNLPGWTKADNLSPFAHGNFVNCFIPLKGQTVNNHHNLGHYPRPSKINHICGKNTDFKKAVLFHSFSYYIRSAVLNGIEPYHLFLTVIVNTCAVKDNCRSFYIGKIFIVGSH